MLKRDNWTTEEVIKLILGSKVCDSNGIPLASQGDHNSIVEEVASVFKDFQRPKKEFGALAYDSDSGHVVHVGDIPKEMLQEFYERNKK